VKTKSNCGFEVTKISLQSKENFMTFNNIQQYKLGALLLTCLFAFGCSDKVSVTGMVTYSDNGEVVKNGEIVFTGEQEMGRAVITNGRYSAGLAKDGEGLRPGTYTISTEARTPPIPVDRLPPGIDLASLLAKIDIYYLKEPITLEVKGRTTHDFTVERGERPRERR